jgi:hypothetical protein
MQLLFPVSTPQNPQTQEPLHHLMLLFFVHVQFGQKNFVLSISFVVAIHHVPNLVGLPLLREDSTFTMASPFIVVHTQPHVKLMLDVTTSYVLILPHPNHGTLPMMMILVLLVLPILVLLLPTIQ